MPVSQDSHTALYVSPNGRDHAPGSPSAPLATLEEARHRLRLLRQQGLCRGATVFIRGGQYQRATAFDLKEQDSGQPEAPVVYCAFPGEQVRLLGGRLISGFSQVTDPAVLARLPESARAHVLQCDLKSQDISDFGRFVSRGFGRPTSPAHLELFFGGKRLEVARWPNGEFTHIGSPARLHAEGDGHGGSLGRLEAGFLYKGDRPSRWQSLDHVWLHGYWAWDWANSCEQLESFDPATGLIRTRPPHGLYGFKSGQRFYFLNVLEELDQPGEYYLDRHTGVLYFWPPGAVEESEVAVSLLEEPLIRTYQASHLRFERLILEYGRGTGVQIQGGQGVELAGCILRNLGNHAVLVEGGRGHRVQGCDVYHTGDSGIRLSGGDRKTLDPGQHQARNNHIHHMGQWSRCYQPGILVQGVGHHLAHNLIHHGPHCAILLSGNEHLIEYNCVHHVCQETGDVGAFYMGRDWTERGNVLRHNFFHHTQGIGMGSMAVYLDDCASGTTVYGNLFYQCTRAVFIGGGRNNRVENNLFIDCQPAIQIDGRGLDPRPVWRAMVQQTMKERLQAMDHHRPPYSARYPDLRQLDPYYAEGAGIPPEGNLIVRNVCAGGQWLSIHWHADPRLVAVQHNLTDEDPLFASRQTLDFRLRADSPAWELGFRPIPLEKIGPYLDQYRTALPDAALRPEQQVPA
jgi:hypothetical protein